MTITNENQNQTQWMKLLEQNQIQEVEAGVVTNRLINNTIIFRRITIFKGATTRKTAALARTTTIMAPTKKEDRPGTMEPIAVITVGLLNRSCR
jgi:hypothetical protein